MITILLDLNLLVASEVWALDSSLRAFGLMLDQLDQTCLDYATKLAVLAGMRNLLNHLVDYGIGTIFGHRSSARRTGLHINSAGFTN